VSAPFSSVLKEKPRRLEFVPIKPGSFMMGCSPGDNECYSEEKPSHAVEITRPFELGKFQVTQSQYEEVMGCNPSYFTGPNYPVDGVSWDDAQRFCEKLNARNDGYHYRLPAEAEWEFCARDLPTRGQSLDDGWLVPLAQRAGEGFAGGAWTWTQSDYAPYPGYRPAAGAVGEYNGKFMVNQRVLRGGASVTPPGHARRTYRNFFPAAARWAFAGLRLAWNN